jgi:signal peptidase I
MTDMKNMKQQPKSSIKKGDIVKFRDGKTGIVVVTPRRPYIELVQVLSDSQLKEMKYYENIHCYPVLHEVEKLKVIENDMDLLNKLTKRYDNGYLYSGKEFRK